MYSNEDPAYEEYLSTGIDPTGGELGPDFDPNTGKPIEDEETAKKVSEYKDDEED